VKFVQSLAVGCPRFLSTAVEGCTVTYTKITR